MEASSIGGPSCNNLVDRPGAAATERASRSSSLAGARDPGGAGAMRAERIVLLVSLVVALGVCQQYRPGRRSGRAGNPSGNPVVATAPTGIEPVGRRTHPTCGDGSECHQADGPCLTSNPCVPTPRTRQSHAGRSAAPKPQRPCHHARGTQPSAGCEAGAPPVRPPRRAPRDHARRWPQHHAG